MKKYHVAVVIVVGRTSGAGLQAARDEPACVVSIRVCRGEYSKRIDCFAGSSDGIVCDRKIDSIHPDGSGGRTRGIGTGAVCALSSQTGTRRVTVSPRSSRRGYYGWTCGLSGAGDEFETNRRDTAPNASVCARLFFAWWRALYAGH